MTSEIIENAQRAVERLECEDWEYTPFEPYCHRLTCKRCLLSRAVDELTASEARADALAAENARLREGLIAMRALWHGGFKHDRVHAPHVDQCQDEECQRIGVLLAEPTP
jgi:hypothetical protein